MNLLQQLADELTTQSGLAVDISDLRLNSLAAGPQPVEVDWVRRDSVLTRLTPGAVRDYYAARGVGPGLRDPLEVPGDPGRGIERRWVLPARAAGRTHGFVWFIGDGSNGTACAGNTAVTELIASIGRELARGDLVRADRAATLRDLVGGGEALLAETAARVSDSGVFPAGPVQAVVVPGGRNPPVPHDVWAADLGGATVLLLPPRLAARPEAVHRLARSVSAGVTGVAGVGDPVPTLARFRESHRQARLAARAAAAGLTRDRAATWSSLGGLRALAVLPPADAAAAVDPGVRRLHDGEPVLFETLSAFLTAGSLAQPTAERLRVSRGTVYYRLQRAQAVSGLSLKDARDRLTLEVGVALMLLHPDPDRT